MDNFIRIRLGTAQQSLHEQKIKELEANVKLLWKDYKKFRELLESAPSLEDIRLSFMNYRQWLEKKNKILNDR